MSGERTHTMPINDATMIELGKVMARTLHRISGGRTMGFVLIVFENPADLDLKSADFFETFLMSNLGDKESEMKVLTTTIKAMRES